MGTTRSGTTILTLMLDHHPELCAPGEFVFALEFDPAGEEAADLGSYHDYLATDRHFLAHELAVDPSLGYSQLLRSLLAQMQQNHPGGAGKPHLSVAVHRAYDRLVQQWPEARYVHLVRDPRDVCASWIRFGWRGNGWTGGREWSELEALWEQVSARLEPDQVLEMSFEELVRDPEASLRRLCEFAGLAYSDRMLSYPDDSTYDPVDAGEAEKWRRSLGERQIRLVEAAAGPWLARRGYAPSGLPPLEVGRLGQRILRAHDRLHGFRSRIRIYGWRLWLARRVARALGLRAWQHRIQLQHHAITNSRVK